MRLTTNLKFCNDAKKKGWWPFRSQTRGKLTAHAINELTAFTVNETENTGSRADRLNVVRLMKGLSHIVLLDFSSFDRYCAKV